MKAGLFKSRFFWVILLVGLALLGMAWVVYSQESATEFSDTSELGEAPIPGYLAPQFTLVSTIGEEINLSDFQGQPVVLNFWASWCPPCRAEMPHFQQASQKYNGRAVILGIDQGEPLSVVADFANSMGISYPLLLDEDNRINRAYGVAALPTTIFIDSNGVVHEVITGVVNAAVLQDRIEQLISEG